MTARITRKPKANLTKEGPGSPAPPSSARTNESQTLGTLIDLETARLVVIHDVWSGMGPDSPIAAAYELRRTEAGALVGEVRQFKRGAFHRSQALTLSPDAVSTLLRLLAAAVLARGSYTPLIEHTDDFPSVEIAVHVGPESKSNGIALLFSSSQGKFNAPWGACVRGEVFTLAGDEIGRALGMLRRVVQETVEDAKAHAKRFVEALDKQFRPTRKPGEVMSRKEAAWWGGEEMGGMLYRLANSEKPPRKRAPSSKSRKKG